MYSFKALSTAPAPIPRGIAKRKSHQKFGVRAKPVSPMAVSKTLNAVTFPVPSFRINFTLNKEETIVPAEITKETKPACPTGIPKSKRIVGQAAPNIPSGSPKLIKAI